MSPEPSPRRLLVRALVIGAVVLGIWLLLRAQREAAPPAPSPAGTSVPAPAPTAGAHPTPPAVPAPGASAAPTTPPATPDSSDASAPPRAAATDVAPPATSVDERQDAKIARGLASNAEGGLIVASAPPASVAAALRLQPGDVILTVNGTTVSTPADFVRLYREQGMPSELTILRSGREMHLH
jgi:hypothetical protein